MSHWRRAARHRETRTHRPQQPPVIATAHISIMQAECDRAATASRQLQQHHRCLPAVVATWQAAVLTRQLRLDHSKVRRDSCERTRTMPRLSAREPRVVAKELAMSLAPAAAIKKGGGLERSTLPAWIHTGVPTTTPQNQLVDTAVERHLTGGRVDNAEHELAAGGAPMPKAAMNASTTVQPKICTSAAIHGQHAQGVC